MTGTETRLIRAERRAETEWKPVAGVSNHCCLHHSGESDEEGVLVKPFYPERNFILEVERLAFID